MVRKVSLSPRKPKAVMECFDCGKKLRGMPRVILVDVWGTEEAQEQKAQSKVKQRRWFCDYYCVQTFLARVTTTKVLPPRRS